MNAGMYKIMIRKWCVYVELIHEDMRKLLSCNDHISGKTVVLCFVLLIVSTGLNAQVKQIAKLPKIADTGILERKDYSCILIIVTDASFAGGQEGFKKYIDKQLVIPSDTPNGTAIVSFAVEKNGAIVDVCIFRKLNPMADQEALRLVTFCPKWSPAIDGGRVYKQKFLATISFDPLDKNHHFSIVK